MSSRQVVNEPEVGQTEEVEDCVGGSGGLDAEECLGAAAAPSLDAVGEKGRKKDSELVNQLKLDDDLETKEWTDMLNAAVRGLEKCANEYFPSVQGKEHKVERRENLKKLHEASVKVVGARMKMERAPGVVQKVFEEMDLERAAVEVDDDEAFCAMLDEFEEASMAEIDKIDEEISYENDISKDEDYNACLEVLNVYQKTGGSKKRNDDDVDGKSEEAGPSTRYFGGVEVKQEIEDEGE